MNGMQEIQEIHRKIQVNESIFVGNLTEEVWKKSELKIREIYEQFMKDAPGKTLYAMGKKLIPTGRYTGYFWATRDANGKTHIRGFFGVYGVLEGSSAKHSYIIANFHYVLDTGEVSIRWREQFFTLPGWSPRKKEEKLQQQKQEQEQDQA
jgi:hypothetical protein